MSASAINSAASTAPATPAAGANAGAQGNRTAGQAVGALEGFEAMIASLFGVEAAADAAPTATATKTGAKTATSGKTTTDDGKDAAGDKTAATDATAGADVNLALLTPVVPAPLATTVQAGATDAEVATGVATQAIAGATPDKTDKSGNTAGQAVAGALAELTADAKTAPDATATKATAQSAADVAANASAKVDLAATPKITAPAAPSAPQPAATPATPATDTPPPTPAVVTAAAVASDAAAAATTPLTVPAAEAPAPVAPAPTAPATKTAAPKASARVDATTVEAAPGSAAALTAKAANALQPVTSGAPQTDLDADDGRAPLLDAKAEAPSPAQGPVDQAISATTTPANLVHAAAAAARGAPQTVANLAAQIVQKLGGRSTQFDVQLDPVGLGKVDVRISIGADGRMSAAMSFDTPQAASELKARAAELQRAMEQAGFDLSGGMSFDVTGGDRGQGGNAQQQQQPEFGAAFRGRAFQAALDTQDAAPPPQLMLRRSAMSGVDIRI